jgi:hypothetical protein
MGRSCLFNWLRSKMDTVANRHNFQHICGSFYLVRTQAGFVQAVKHYWRSDPVDWDRVEGYPRSYPSLISISTGYRGYTYIRVDVHHVNKFKLVIAES